MNEIEQLVRPNILALKPYSSARDEFKSTSATPLVMLDANENSLGGPLEQDFSRYPDPQQRALKASVATLKSVRPEQIFLGNGSDEAIDLLIRVFCAPGRDRILILPPTYGMYAVQATIQGAEVLPVPLLPDFRPDVAAILQNTDARNKLLFFCSPNNPSGNRLPDESLLQILDHFPGIVVVDEAYIDFSEAPSVLTLLARYPKLVVLQTFSKAWGLAGLRIGMAFSSKLIVNILNKIKYPYNLNVVTTDLALQALQRTETVRQNVEQLRRERERLAALLPQFKCVEQVFPSDANFLLVRFTQADALYDYLCSQGLVVRNRSREPLCANCLRITIGAPVENDLLLNLLARFEQEKNLR